LPAQVPTQGKSNYVVSGSISVSGDSVSPYPHEHSINLYFNTGQGRRFAALCTELPKAGRMLSGSMTASPDLKTTFSLAIS
jgi:hypothetical protein